MANYVSIPTITDPDALAQDAFEYLQSKVPSWAPHDAQQDTWIMTAAARMIATLNDTVSDVQTNIYRYLGANLFGLPPLEATPATATTTWTMTDTAGHTVPAGTAVAVPQPGGELVAFETLTTFEVPAGQNKTAEGAVVISAVTPGKEGTGLGVKGTVISLLDQLAFVATGGITLANPTAGGQDAEEDGVYLGRLVAQLRLMAPRPIVPNDFAELARTIPGVARALAINGYNPENGLFTNERTVAIAALDANGLAVSGGVKTEIELFLLSKREVNFIIKMIDPTFTKIGVEWEIKKWSEWTAADVEKRINEALATFLSSKTWGLPPFGDRTLWYTRPEVKVNDVIAAIGAVPGVADVLSVKLKKAAGAFEVKDVVLTGVAPLPETGELKGVVV